ncbi:MAG: Rieske 2Fe-2S domain-containing protein [Bacteroidota bacterium]
MKVPLSRRIFLQQTGALTVTLLPVLFAASGCATGLSTYRVSASEGKVILDPLQYPELALEGGAIEVEVPSHHESVLIVRIGEGSYAAVSPVCTHLGCTVRKEPSFFRCPCHGSTYTLEGAVVRGPAEEPLERYPVQFINNLLTIQLQS